MMKGGLGNIMKQAQAMQENLRKAQEELAKVEVTGVSGGGLVSVIMTCRHDVRRVEIDPDLLGDDKEVLEDLIAAAVNDAVRKAEKASQEKLSGLTAGLGIPGLNLPF
ncbi:MAG TPA: YbaB/EbfC family nucleoid-associated protein [Acidiferrobacterales bacterium]|jgi:DNA-binding YbaB/EbfC family protein